jgi:hypothetical protein
MKTYERFINDYVSNQWKDEKTRNNRLRRGSKELSEKQFMNLVNKNCKEFLKNPKLIYRGVAAFDDLYYYVNPNAIYRPPVNNGYEDNLYQVFFDTSKNWSEYPKRSKSVMCSLNFSTANRYGNVYNVIPYDGSEWCVSPKPDFWDCFKERIGTDDLPKFFKKLIDFYEHVYDSFYTSKNLKIYSEKILDKFKTLHNSDSPGVKEKNIKNDIEYLFSELGEKLIPSTNKSFYDKLDKLLAPKANGFKLVNYENLKGKYNEVYTESKCLLIEYKKFQRLFKI